VPNQRCWAHKLRNLENKLEASQQACLEEAKLIYQAANRTEAIGLFRQWKRRWQRFEIAVNESALVSLTV